MYRVRGADQNVYGPIDAETVRQWIRERRLNGESQICRDGEEVWQKLGQLAEFSGDLSVSVVPAVPTGAVGGGSVGGFVASREAILVQVKPAAICMIVYGVSMWMAVLFNAVNYARSDGKQELPPGLPQWFVDFVERMQSIPAPVQWGMLLISAVVGSLVVFGGIKFLRLQSLALVKAAAILMIIPCFSSFCCCIGLGFGIWALVLLKKPEIQAEFR
jgi:hypothetical protein